MNHEIIISVIIPVYNAEKYLVECIESVISQSFERYELILIDDGSTDSSLEICKEYEAKDARISVLHQENCGVSKARNVGLDNSHGKYVCFVDSDDVLIPEALEVLVSAAVSGSSDIVCANAWRWNGNEKRKLFDTKDRIVKENLLSEIVHFALWAQLFNLDVIRQHHIRFVEGLAYSEDAVFVSCYALYANSISFVSRPVYFYRINEESACRSVDKERIAHHQFGAAREFAKLTEQNCSVSSKDLSALKDQVHIRTKLGISAFLETKKRYNISYQLSVYNKGNEKVVSKAVYMRLYLICLYRYYKKTIHEYLR